MGLATKPSVTVGEATKKQDYDNLVNFVSGSEQLSGDAGITLTTSDFGKFVTVNSAAAQIVNLPSVDASHVGGWFIVVKLGAGKVTIQAADLDVINDSSAGGTIYNDLTDETSAVIKLRLVTATKWVIESFTGVGWRTT